MSESQERMCAIVEPAKVERFLAVCRKWDVLATVIGEVTDGDRLTVDWHGERIVDVPPRTVAHEGRSEEHTSELQSRQYLVCRLLLEKKKENLHRWHHLYSPLPSSSLFRLYSVTACATRRGLIRLSSDRTHRLSTSQPSS